MTRQVVGVALVLSTLLLGTFASLALDPSSLIVDADHPSVDHARPRDDPAVGNDLTRLFLPHHLAIGRSLAKLGHVPQWDDRGFGGRPLIGNPQAGLFYPPTWLAWWSEAPSTLGWITVAHLLFLGFGTYRLARTLEIGVAGSLFAAGCVQISPYVLAQTFEGHYPHVWAACWYPWAFDAALKLRRGDFARGLMLAPILAATLLAGHPQEGYYLLIALGFWVAYDGLVSLRARQIRPTCRFWAVWALIVILGLGLTGVEIIPDALAQEWTLKGVKLSIRMAGRYHVYPINFLQLLSPSALGGPADYFGHEKYWESVLSIGLIPLSLAIIGLAWSPDRRVVRGWLILVVASVLFASGRKFGVFPLLFEILPGMNRFRVPARSLFLASLGASILAGLGVEALRVRASEIRGWAKLVGRASIVTGLIGALVLVAKLLPISTTSEPTETIRLHQAAIRLTGDPSFWLGLGAVPILLILSTKVLSVRARVGLILGILGLVELTYHGSQLIKTTPASRYFGPDPISQALLEARSPGVAPTRIRVVDALYDDLRAEQMGLEKTNVNDSFQIQHAADLYERLYHLFDAHKFIGEAPMDQAVALYRRQVRQGVLDRMAVALLVDDRLDPEATWPIVASGEWYHSRYIVYRNPAAMPRAYVVPRVEVAPDDRSIFDRLNRVDPRDAVLMPFDPLEVGPVARQKFQPAEWISDDPDRIVLRVATDSPGLLVIAETWMPGWSATVDGKSTPILRGNHAQRVVPLLEPGNHEVVLTYRTPGLTSGLALTIGSAVVWLVLVLWVQLGFKKSDVDGNDPGPPPPR